MNPTDTKTKNKIKIPYNFKKLKDDGLRDVFVLITIARIVLIITIFSCLFVFYNLVKRGSIGNFDNVLLCCMLPLSLIFIVTIIFSQRVLSKIRYKLSVDAQKEACNFQFTVFLIGAFVCCAGYILFSTIASMLFTINSNLLANLETAFVCIFFFVIPISFLEAFLQIYNIIDCFISAKIKMILLSILIVAFFIVSLLTIAGHTSGIIFLPLALATAYVGVLTLIKLITRKSISK